MEKFVLIAIRPTGEGPVGPVTLYWQDWSNYKSRLANWKLWSVPTVFCFCFSLSFQMSFLFAVLLLLLVIDTQYPPRHFLLLCHHTSIWIFSSRERKDESHRSMSWCNNSTLPFVVVAIHFAVPSLVSLPFHVSSNWSWDTFSYLPQQSLGSLVWCIFGYCTRR